MDKPKLKEHLYLEMVNELRDFSLNVYASGFSDEGIDHIGFITDIEKIVSKYIDKEVKE